MMFRALTHVDHILRQRRWASVNTPPWVTAIQMVTVISCCGALYGSVMGSFGGWALDRLPQVAYSAMKVPLLLLVTFAVSAPSFYVVNMLFGLGQDFRLALRAVVSTQAIVSIVLASSAPYTILWYVSYSDYGAAVLWNACAFGLASLIGQWSLRTAYRPLIQRNAKHRHVQWSWLCVYALVGIQMGWVLRPFIGDPSKPPQFLRATEFTNAYVVVIQLIKQALWG